MNILTIVFGICILALFVVHTLSAVQLYKQRSLGPYAVPSVVVLSSLWGLAFFAALINFLSYLASF